MAARTSFNYGRISHFGSQNNHKKQEKLYEIQRTVTDIKFFNCIIIYSIKFVTLISGILLNENV